MYLFMKIVIAVLVLIFSLQSLTEADDIRDFEIEGISIGDSLLEYFDENEIKSSYKKASFYKNNVFAVIFVKNNSKKYDRIQVTVKPDDKNHVVFAIEGIIDFDKKINKCNEKKKSIIDDLKHLFVDYERLDDDRAYAADKTNKSFSYSTWFFLNTGGFISVSCTEMGKEVRKSYGWTDELSIAVTSEELETFLRGDPF